MHSLQKKHVSFCAEGPHRKVRLEEEIQSEEEVKEHLEMTCEEYDALKRKCDELLPRLKHLLAASLVANERCADAREARRGAVRAEN